MTAPVKLIDDKGERLFLAGWGFNPRGCADTLILVGSVVMVLVEGAAVTVQGC